MDRNEELISKRYDALMFARTPEEAKRAARLLADAVLGEEGVAMPLERALKEVCRKIRPASDARDQARFEAEFLELAFAPAPGANVAARTNNPQTNNGQPNHTQSSRSKAA
jgi:hypothetical protein